MSAICPKLKGAKTRILLKNFPRIFLTLAFILSFWLNPLSDTKLYAQGDRIAAASYPVWLFTRYLNDGRNYFNVELLTSPETGCPHEFNPRPRDLERLTQTKIMVENGVNLEVYLERALRVAPPDIFLIDASNGVPTLLNNYGRLAIPGDPTTSTLVPNPHIFLSPKNASLMAENIAKALSEKDPAGSVHYQDRLERFQASMITLEEEIQFFKRTHRGYKVVTSHGFMDYLAQELGILIVADIEAVPEVAPSPARLTALVQIIRQEGVSAILVDPESDHELAQTLGREAGVPVAIVDPATSGTSDPPVDYYQQVIRADLKMLSRLFPVNTSGN
jgi:ABC-type Zn uptake system ZnuABC Zn-binding protein ZnuA